MIPLVNILGNVLKLLSSIDTCPAESSASVFLPVQMQGSIYIGQENYEYFLTHQFLSH